MGYFGGFGAKKGVFGGFSFIKRILGVFWGILSIFGVFGGVFCGLLLCKFRRGLIKTPAGAA